MTLSYPLDIGSGLSDFVTFTPMEYRAQSQGGSAPVSGGAQGVTLYMPNSTPPVGNPQSWGPMTGFSGPMGAMFRDAAVTAASSIDRIGGDGTVSGYLESVKKDLAKVAQGTNFGEVGKQGAMNVVAGLTPATPNQLLALSRGKVYNPNVELLYEQPGFRNFTFHFDFLPKNPGEANVMNEIIRNFKSNSAPEDLENGMYKLPFVWQVKYHVGGGGENQFMNKFKPAACTAVAVQANQGTDMHVSHVDGSPVQTTLTLDFMEVEIITRIDHQNAGGQGY